MKKIPLFVFATSIILLLTLSGCYRTKPIISETIYNPEPMNGSEINVNNIYLKWEFSLEEKYVEKFIVYYSDNPDEMGRSFEVSNDYFPALNLKAGTWFWRIEAIDLKGNVTVSPIWNFRVKGENIPKPINDDDPVLDPSLIVTNVENDSFQLSWTEFLDTSDPDYEINYTVYLYKKEMLSVPRNVDSMIRGIADYVVETTDTSYHFENMGSKTKYDFTILARNRIGNSAEVGTSEVMTGNRIPVGLQIISPVECESNVSTDLTLTWKAAVDPDGDPVRYFIYLDNIPNTNRMVGSIDGTTDCYYKPQEIETGKNYYWTILVKDSNGAATRTTQHSFRTVSPSIPQPIPVFPENNRNDIDSTSDILFQWLYSPKIKYSILFGESPKFLRKIGTNIISGNYKFKGEILPEKSYYWKVIAENENGCACESEIFTFKTTKIPEANFLSALTNKEGTQIEITFDRNMTDPSGNHSQFSVYINTDQKINIETISVSIKPGDAKKYLLSLGQAVNYGDKINLSYSSGNIKSTSGGNLRPFSATEVINYISGEKPICNSASVTTNGKSVIISFDKTMNSPSGKKEQFGVLVEGYVNEIDGIDFFEGNKSIYELKLRNPIGKGNRVHVSYTRGNITAENGGELETFVNRSVFNGSVNIIVNKNTGWNFRNINSAIDYAVKGDTILVLPGIYRETVNFDGKEIEVKSNYENNPEAKNETVIDGENSRPNILFITNESNKSILRGFVIRNGYFANVQDITPILIRKDVSGGITIHNASPTIYDNTIIENKSLTGAGMVISGGNPSVFNNVFSHNRTDIHYPEDGRGGAIYIEGGNETDSNPRIYSNTFVENNSFIGSNIYLKKSGERVNILNFEGRKWKHFNSPPEEINYIENTETNNNIYSNNSILTLKRSLKDEGEYICFSTSETSQGSSSIDKNSLYEGDSENITLSYTSGQLFRNGSIKFNLPKGFDFTDAYFTFTDNSTRCVREEEINNHSTIIEGIFCNPGDTIKITLVNQLIPTGSKDGIDYEFSCNGDADGQWKSFDYSDFDTEKTCLKVKVCLFDIEGKVLTNDNDLNGDVKVTLEGFIDDEKITKEAIIDLVNNNYIFNDIKPGNYSLITESITSDEHSKDIISLEITRNSTNPIIIPSLVIRKKADHIIVLRDVAAWSSPNAIPDILEELGFTSGEGKGKYEIKGSGYINSIAEFDTSHLLIVEGDQTTEFYDVYKQNTDKFDDFVNEGGTIFWVASDKGWTNGDFTGTLPGGLTWLDKHLKQNIIVNQSNPLLEDFPEVPLNGNSASHGGFDNLSQCDEITNAVTLINEYGDSNNNPTFISYTFGLGRVIASCTPLEFYVTNEYQDSKWFVLLLRRSIELALNLPFTPSSAIDNSENYIKHEISSSGL